MKIEALEARIAPAAFVSFTDVDGDQVELVSDKALGGTVAFTAALNPAEILVSGAGLDGAGITTVVKRAAGGDGFVNIGRIVATGLDLGVVTVKGDLGKIVCGNVASALPALKALNVRSMGVFGTETQGGGNLLSTISGDLGALNVASDVTGAQLNVGGRIGAVKIGGDLRGTSASFSGRISASGAGRIAIGGDLAAGAGDESGKLIISGDLGALTIGGSVYGAVDGVPDAATGQITVSGNAGPVTIKRDLFGSASQQKALDLRQNAGAITIGGSLLGLAGIDSAAIYVGGSTGSITIGRDLSGGSGANSGSIFISGNTGPVKVGRDLLGGSGGFSAALVIGGTVGGSFSIGGDVRGGTGTYMDGIALHQVLFGGATGAVRVGGDIVGNTGRGSGTFLIQGDAPSFFLGGSLTGGGGEQAGIFLFPGGSIGMGNVGSVTIAGDIRETALGGGHIAAGTVGKLLIKGSIFGTDGTNSLSLISGPIVETGNAGSVRIEGSIVGASTPALSSTDFDLSMNSVKKLEVLGSLEGASAYGSGSIRVNGSAGSIKIGGSLHGSTGTSSAAISAGSRIGVLTIGGSVVSGGGSYSTAQIAAQSFGKVFVGGDLIGGSAGSGELRATTGGFDAITIKGSLYAGAAGGAITAAKGLGAVKIGGSISGGFAMNHNSILALNAKSITIGGDLITNGNGGNSLINIRESAGAVKIGGSVRGAANDPAHLIFGLAGGFAAPGFTSLAIKGSVSYGVITGGIRGDFVGENGDAVLGAISIGGDFIASSIAAGVNRTDMHYADANDAVIANGTPALSRIAAITIKGQVLGSAAMGDHFGFIAQSIGAVKIGAFTYTPGTTPIELSEISGDVTLRLV